MFTANRASRLVILPPYSWGTSLIGIPAANDRKCCFHQNPHIESERPVAQVVQVVLDAQTHLLNGIRFPTKSMNLGPTGYAWTNLVPDHVAADQLAVLLVVGNGVRTRAHETHSAFEHVEQLR